MIYITGETHKIKPQTALAQNSPAYKLLFWFVFFIYFSFGGFFFFFFSFIGFTIHSNWISSKEGKRNAGMSKQIQLIHFASMQKKKMNYK